MIAYQHNLKNVVAITRTRALSVSLREEVTLLNGVLLWPGSSRLRRFSRNDAVSPRRRQLLITHHPQPPFYIIIIKKNNKIMS